MSWLSTSSECREMGKSHFWSSLSKFWYACFSCSFPIGRLLFCIVLFWILYFVERDLPELLTVAQFMGWFIPAVSFYFSALLNNWTNVYFNLHWSGSNEMYLITCDNLSNMKTANRMPYQYQYTGTAVLVWRYSMVQHESVPGWNRSNPNF